MILSFINFKTLILTKCSDFLEKIEFQKLTEKELEKKKKKKERVKYLMGPSPARHPVPAGCMAAHSSTANGRRRGAPAAADGPAPAAL
jgi:hypothetical protein